MTDELALGRYGLLRRVARACRGLSVSEKRRRVMKTGGDVLGISVPPEKWPALIDQDSESPDDVTRFSLAYLADLLREAENGAPEMCADTDFVGYSPEIVRIRSRLAGLARTAAGVLLIGERGTGKGQLVRALGARMGETPLTVALASMPQELADSELFGHRKGAFTGAQTHRTGIILEAKNAGRLLFLDDVAECSPAIQAKLLTALDDGVVRPVGSDDVVTLGRGANRQLRLVSSSQPGSLGNLRRDILDRLATMHVWIPPLRNRGLDILLLADYFAELTAGGGVDNDVLSDGTRMRLMGYDWPGNVRQLFNVILRAAAEAGQGNAIGEDVMSLALADEDRLTEAYESGRTSVNDSPSTGDPASGGPAPFPTMSEMRDRHFRRALDIAGGNVKRTASLLDVDPSTVHRWRKTERQLQDTTP